MLSNRRLSAVLVAFVTMCAFSPASAGEISDPMYFDYRGDFEYFTAGFNLVTETFQSFPPGTCFDSDCAEPETVTGLAFSSLYSDWCDDPVLGECQYFPIEAVEYFGDEAGEGGGGSSIVLGGGFAEDYGSEFRTATSFVIDFEPPVYAFGFDLLSYFPAVRVDLEFEDGSTPPPTYFAIEDYFVGVLSSKSVARVSIETSFPGATGLPAGLPRRSDPAGGTMSFGTAWNDVIVDSPAGNYEIGDYALDNLTFNLPPQPPLCERIATGSESTNVIEGLATGDPAGGGLEPPVLWTGFPDNLDLTFNFVSAHEVEFYVEFDEAVPDAQGVVVVTDASGGECSLAVDFRQCPPGLVEGKEICVDDADGILIQVDNPPPDEMGPGTLGGTVACSGQPPDVEDFPPAYEPSPDDDPFPCREFIIESPINGTTQTVYKKDGAFDPRLRLLFSEFDGVDFGPYEDITESVEEIADIVPDPSRLVGKSGWSPVRITCAILEPDCDLLGNDINDDNDVDPLCLDGVVVDCSDQNPLINTAAVEGPEAIVGSGDPPTCNGLDDDCDGTIDEGFDPDLDGLAACFDNCPEIANPPVDDCGQGMLPAPRQCDYDEDGVGDPCDNCPMVYNPDQADGNGDGIGDACSDDEGDDEDESDDEFGLHSPPGDSVYQELLPVETNLGARGDAADNQLHGETPTQPRKKLDGSRETGPEIAPRVVIRLDSGSGRPRARRATTAASRANPGGAAGVAV